MTAGKRVWAVPGAALAEIPITQEAVLTRCADYDAAPLILPAGIRQAATAQ